MDDTRFTYQGKQITVTDFAKIIGKNRSALGNLVWQYNYHTGEEIINHYNNVENNKFIFTYHGKPITFVDFAKIIGRVPVTISSLAHKYNYHTGEEIINHYNTNKKLIYHGKPISMTAFAKIIGKDYGTIRDLVKKHNYNTGEDIISHYNNAENNKRLTYQSKPFTVQAFAKLIGKSKSAIQQLIGKYNYHTGEEIVEHYNKIEKNYKLIYQGKHVSMTVFAKSIGKTKEAVGWLMTKYTYCTGEEIIEHYNRRENSKKQLNYQGKLIDVVDFAKLIGKSRKTLYKLISKYGYTTGEEVIDYYSNKTLTYQGKPITVADFGKLIGKSEDAVGYLKTKYSYRTGEEVINHYNIIENNKSLAYQGKHFTIPDFAKLIGKTENAISHIVYRHNYHIGEEVIKHYLESKEGLTIGTTSFKNINNTGLVEITTENCKNLATVDEVLIMVNSYLSQ